MPALVALGFGSVAWLLVLWLLFHHVAPLRPLIWPAKVAIAYTATLVVGLIAYQPIIITHYNREQASFDDGTLSARRGWLLRWALKPREYKPIPIILDDASGGFVYGGKRGESIFKSGQNEPILSVDRDEYGDPLISVTVRDRDGRALVDIVHNHWIVSKSNELIWDKNYRNDSLELVDSQKKIIFQVRILPEEIHILATLFHEENGVWVPISLRMHNEERILPMFRYPSKEHWGEWDCRSANDGGGAPC